MAYTLIIAFTLGHKTYCLLVLYSSFTGIFRIPLLCMGLYLLPSIPVINKVVYVTIAELTYAIIG